MNFVKTAVLAIGMMSLVACGGSSDGGDTMNTANPCEANPCEANPCEGNPCEAVEEEAANPCEGGNPCEAANPCGDAANPCGM